MTSHDDIPIEIAEASRSDARLIEALLDEYLRELSEHREVAVGATDSASYPYLDAYWSERGRHAFLVRQGGRIVGFALVRSPGSTGSDTHQLAEFYVEPQSRRCGIGRHAVLAIWERFPGRWELQVHARNTVAVRFWSSCAQLAAIGPIRVRAVRSEDGQRMQLNFSVGQNAG